jgi:uncharacterized protein
MNKLLSLLLLFFSVAATAQNIPQRPNPPRLVNDFAHVLTSDQIETLERKLVNYDDSTSTQIVVVTVPTTGDYDVDDYALKILRDWGVGNKKTNNGIVILAAINDRKVKIEIGYGLEGAIPDITAKQIIDNEITPNFKQTNYYRGFDEAADAIIKAASGEYRAPQDYRKATSGRRSGGSIFSFLIPLIIIIILVSRSGGGGGGGMMSRRGSNPFLGGLLGGIIGSSLGRGGGGWSGGGGGGGGGGFGGFGGGSGGGGGASGSW